MAKEARFEFSQVLTPLGLVYVPTARVRMTYASASMELEMTVDSGADLSMIPYQVGLGLGMRADASPLRHLTGIAGGGVPYRLRRVGLQIGPFAIKARVAWAQRDDVPVLLGRSDVFDSFAITFDERRRRLIFRG